MLTGETPFRGPNPFAVMNDRMVNDPDPPRELNPEISIEMQEIILRALKRDPENRYASAGAVAEDLAHPEMVKSQSIARRAWSGTREGEEISLARKILSYVGPAIIPVGHF